MTDEVMKLLHSFSLFSPLPVFHLRWDFCCQLGLRARRLRKVPKVVFWVFPITWKLNIDGFSSGKPGPSGGGCVVRDASANVLVVASYFFFRQQNSVTAELLALLRGLERCFAEGFERGVIEMNSCLLVHWLHPSMDPAPLEVLFIVTFHSFAFTQVPSFLSSCSSPG